MFKIYDGLYRFIKKIRIKFLKRISLQQLMTKTQFQGRFQINSEFYTGQQIRTAIEECFPFRSGKYDGLSRIVYQGNSVPFHANKKLDLEKLIPDLGDLPEFRCVGVIEGEPMRDRTAATFFIPTDLWYLCDEMNIPGQDQVFDERLVRA